MKEMWPQILGFHFLMKPPLFVRCQHWCCKYEEKGRSSDTGGLELLIWKGEVSLFDVVNNQIILWLCLSLRGAHPTAEENKSHPPPPRTGSCDSKPPLLQHLEAMCTKPETGYNGSQHLHVCALTQRHAISPRLCLFNCTDMIDRHSPVYYLSIGRLLTSLWAIAAAHPSIILEMSVI